MLKRKGSCLEECQNLLDFHSALIIQFPLFEPYFAPWLSAVKKMQSQPDIESLISEQKLEALALGFRTLWLRSVKRHASSILKSPPHYKSPKNMAGETYNFPYDRWGKPIEFEKLYGDTIELSGGWKGQHLFFGNAMSALSTFFLQCSKSFTKNKISFLGQKGYFEIISLLEFICNKEIVARFTRSQEKFDERLMSGEGDVLILEPVYANSDLTVWNQDAFLKAWGKRPNQISTVILFDTTLVGAHFDLQDFLSCLTTCPPAMVVEVSSALKLHQLGLEFTNLGILSIFTHKSLWNKKLHKVIPKNIRFARQTLGTGINFDEVFAIEFPMLADNGFYKEHCQKIFHNNALLAQEIKSTIGLVKKVIHPSLGTGKDIAWAVSPYVIFSLNEGTETDKRFLKRLLQKESIRRGLCFQSGSSFGFRSHRFEVAHHDEEGEVTFRVAMGARFGPSFEGVVSLLKDVLAHDSFSSLRHAYPKIRHPDDRD